MYNCFMEKHITIDLATQQNLSGGNREDGIVSGRVPATLKDLKQSLDRQRTPRGTAMTVTLSEVREMSGKTQLDVAKSLGVAQGNISKLESKSDLRISSLRSYLEAIGAEAHISVVLKGRSYRLDLSKT